MRKKNSKKQQAISLRKKGMSVRKIAKTLKVSKGSVSVWVRDVILTEKMKQKNINNRISASRKVMLKYSLKRKEDSKAVRLKYQEEGYKMAKELDSNYAFGCALYFGEGTKKRNNCILTNTDIDIVCFFVKFLKKYFKVKNKDFTLTLVHYDHKDLTVSDVTNFWIKKTKISGCRIGKPTIKKGIGKNKYPYGVCSIAVYKTEIVQKIYGSIRAYTNSNEIRFLN